MKPTTEETIIRIPAKPEYVGVARLITAAYAVFMGFDSETAEDIKIAVSEACTTAILQMHKEPGAEQTVEIVAHADDENLMIDVRFSSAEVASLAAGSGDADERDLGVDLLTSIVDNVELIRTADQGTALRLVKRRL